MTYQTDPTGGVTASADEMQTRNVIPVDDLTGATIYGPNEEEIGTIDDLYLDIDEHTIRYATADVGGFLGIGAKTVLIPFENLQWSDRGLFLPVEKDVLENAPEFNPDDIDNREYEEQVGRSWGQDPYWTEEGYGSRHSHRGTEDRGL